MDFGSNIVHVREEPVHGAATLEQIDQNAGSFHLSKHASEFSRPGTNQPSICAIFRMPTEMISEIFLHCLPKPEESGPSIHKAPLLVSQICRHWRRIALSMPQLWSYICLDSLFHRSTFDLLGPWLSRSGTFPLSIILKAHNNLDIGPWFEAMIPLAPRWKHITFQGNARSFRPLLQFSQDSLPLLETLEIHIMDSTASLRALKLFDFAPRLQSLSLCTVDFELSSNLSLFPWKDLTDLTVQGWPSAGDCIKALARCPKLKTASLALGDDCDSSNCPRVILKELYKLDLDTYQADIFMEHLELTALQDLCISGSPFLVVRRSNYYPLADLVSRSGCQLVRLDVNLTSIHEDDLLRCLRLSPALVALDVHDPDFSNFSYITKAFLDAMTYRPVNEEEPMCLVPVLSELVIWSNGVSSEKIDAIFNSRLVPQFGLEPLKNVVIYRGFDSGLNTDESWSTSEDGRVA